MKEKKSVKYLLIRYGICIAVGLSMLFTVLLINNYFKTEDAQNKLRILCDAFCIPGMLLVLSAGLVFVSNEGAFNGVLFGLKRTKDVLLPFLPYHHMNYRTFVEKRKAKKVKGYGFIAISGAAFLTVGVILLIIFQVKYP